MTSDEKLVVAAQEAPEGDTRAFDALVVRHQERVLANCRYLSGSADDAHDLAQEVFVKAFFGLERFQGRSQFGSWVQRIKVNHCLNHLRKRKGKSFLELDDPTLCSAVELQSHASTERDVGHRDMRDRIRTVLDAMPDTLRVPLIMCDLDGFSYQEIADSLELGLSAVKMRIKRAREEFRRLYRE
ncbi:sigma-70 family RNA polymerase sigma factor [bacterium]|nr:sigma-70 family RNA polymerase sigma factor [bacterium]MBU1074095.1 sigma-70 family RNA polymerase sigma factor [bacterium]MBU1676631.1 sigma-70 family RNA polymerase sigma factor [bacterium]